MEYLVTIIQEYTINAKNDIEAGERAEAIEGALFPSAALLVRWNWEMNSSSVEIEEVES